MKNMGKGFLNEGAFSRKRLWERMQSFALAIAKLCVGDCKALRWRLQSFACEMTKLSMKSSVLFWIREKGGKTHHAGHCSLRKILVNRENLCMYGTFFADFIVLLSFLCYICTNTTNHRQ